MRPEVIVAAAREIVGTPYVHQGRIGGVALDCAGVPVHVARTLGIPVEDYASYGRTPNPAELRGLLEKNLLRVRQDEMQIGDVAWLKFRETPQHLAIVADFRVGGFSLIHAYNWSGLSKVVEHPMDKVWKARIVAVWRYPGVEAWHAN